MLLLTNVCVSWQFRAYLGEIWVSNLAMGVASSSKRLRKDITKMRWTLKHPGLTDKEFERLVELDEKEVEGTMTREERKEADRLLEKVRKARNK